MAELTYFRLRGCPYCAEADRLLKKLRGETPAYAGISIREVVENEEKALADSYDYYYVPAFYAGRRKLHEGALTEAGLRAVFDDVLAQE